ncbi:hypothetical protein [Winogradskyella endarachnes]|uniref:Uncharacterized protein n=1 Tax=Winogradskyella endarachnes TaxID=2681965 RepID=A0A6L6U8L0_9FLAO|nr:hypothetical protein [Winogradskyella endarachnes]MUU77212.1 hypothetical protein [Winogradskyella endarachnes]
MRTDNRSIKNTIVTIYFVFMVIALLFVTVFSSFHLIENYIAHIGLFLLLILIGIYVVARFFEYDSDSSKLIITSKGFILTEYINYREYKKEIEKRTVISFKIYNFLFYKSLVILRRSGDKVNVVKERFNITLLKKKKINYIKQSLRKIIKENKKAKLG